jgi:hypothetical protein
MSLPSSPINGQLVTLNGITYTYSTVTNSLTRVLNSTLSVATLNVSGAVTIAQTSTIAGANILTTATIGTYASLGPQGVQGTTGAQGQTGSQGLQGLQGQLGAQGLQGVQGVAIQGSAGIQGTQGLQGVQGVSGFVGSTGTQGIQGVQGLIGSQGVQGLIGSQGVQGLQGGIGNTGTFSGTTTSTVNINNSTATTSTNTGALTVTGGVGVGGNLYVGGTITANQLTIQYTTITQTQVTSPDIFTITNTTQSISTTTGALAVYGGVGIGGNLNVSGTIVGGGVRSTTSSTPPANPTVGDIWYNSSSDIMYRYDYDGVGYYWVDVTSDSVNNLFTGGNVNASIIPLSTGVYDLGSATARFRTLYVTSSTIDLGGVPISVSGGAIQVNNFTSTGTITAPTINNTSTLQLQTGGTPAITIGTNQYVGIGTTSPTNKLTVNTSAGYDGIFVNSTSASTAARVQVANNGSASVQIDVGGTTRSAYGGSGPNIVSITADSSSGFNIGTDDANFLALYTNNNNRLHIDSSGNVGIGVTDPASYSSKLNVAGNIGASAGGNLRVWDPTNTTYVQMNSPSSRVMRWTTDAATEYMRLTSTNLDLTSTFLSYASGAMGIKMFGGFAYLDTTFSMTVNCVNAASLFVSAAFNHYGLINGYGTSRLGFVSVGTAGAQENNVHNASTTYGGSWTFSQSSPTQLTITHNAGTYNAPGYYSVFVIGNYLG